MKKLRFNCKHEENIIGISYGGGFFKGCDTCYPMPEEAIELLKIYKKGIGKLIENIEEQLIEKPKECDECGQVVHDEEY